ncbi:MAG: tRNA 2-thiocytidine biosynthesis protein TtcA [Selenomonadaceae bacterium]|nr:tRNA 2-thiocytidine biosynthesis protein TtcA [Selenomonadaceae bacterium]MBQ3726037.1 tRNA 2-thiocytidine biosynthesis protein TtcA [Selenomonadaceae bacterium]
MRCELPQILFSKIIRAVVEFEMISDGDKILIGVSGGKDSLLLTYALATLRERAKKNFSLRALTIDPKFSEDLSENISGVKKFCNELGIAHEVCAVDIAAMIREQNDKSPCYTCAYFRRAVMNRRANELGANKVAYAHHLDDAVETFFMSLLSSGQLTTFLPKTFLDRTNITVIRPLVYVREHEIKNFTRGFEVLKSPCPFDGATNRQRVKNLIDELEKIFPDLFSHLAAALRKNSIGELWDAPKTREQMRAEYFALKFGGSSCSKNCGSGE